MRKNWLLLLSLCLIWLPGCQINQPLPVVTLPCGLDAVVLNEASNFRSDTAIAIDSNNKAHVVYRLSETDSDDYHSLAYATNASGGWRQKKEWQLSTFATYSAIAVDSRDKVHICTTGDGTGENVTYLTNKTGYWIETVVDSNYSVGLESDIALDQNDNVYLSYWQWNGDNLRFATNALGSWRSEEVDGDQAMWLNTSIMLDSRGAVNIVYAKARQILLASNATGSWVKEIVPLDLDPIQTDNGLAAIMDEQDNLYVLSPTGLAIRRDGQWSQDDFLTAVVPDAHSSLTHLDEDSIAVDQQGFLHICFLIAYPLTGPFKLYYASNLLGDWRAKEIDNWRGSTFGYDNGLSPGSLATDHNGKVHLVYVRNQPNQDKLLEVRYCTFNPFELLSE